MHSFCEFKKGKMSGVSGRPETPMSPMTLRKPLLLKRDLLCDGLSKTFLSLLSLCVLTSAALINL